MRIFGLRFYLGQYKEIVYECNVTTAINNNESLVKAASFTLY
jgi:hypothetical protein